MNDSALIIFMFTALATLSSGVGLLSTRVLHGIMGFALGFLLWGLNWQLWLYYYPDIPQVAWVYGALATINVVMLSYGSIKSMRGVVNDNE